MYARLRRWARSLPAGALAAFALAGLLLLPRRAHAGIAASGPPQELAPNKTRVGVESVWARFDLPGAKGDYFGFAARTDLRMAPRVSLRLEVPVYTLHLDGDGTKTGLGDVELRMRVLLLNADDWRVYAGLADQLPTGETSQGLGQGADQLTPVVTGGKRFGRLVLYVTLADALVVRAPHAASTPDYVDPSTDHELRYVGGSIYELTDALYANAAITGITVLVPSQLGQTLANGGLALGLSPTDAWKLVAGVQVPIAGDKRFDVRGLLGAYFFFL